MARKHFSLLTKQDLRGKKRAWSQIEGSFDVVMASENLLAFAMDLDMLMMVLVQLFCKLRSARF